MYPDSTLWIKDFTKFRNTLKGSTPFFFPSFNLIVIEAYEFFFYVALRTLFKHVIYFNNVLYLIYVNIMLFDV